MSYDCPNCGYLGDLHKRESDDTVYCDRCDSRFTEENLMDD